MEPVLDYQPPSPRSPSRFLRYWPYAALPLFWIGYLLGPLSIPLSLLGAAGLVFLVKRRRFLVAMVFIVLSPFAVSATLAANAYFRGIAALHGRGLMRGCPNVDPETRLVRVSGSCIVMGHEWMNDGVNNLTLRVLIKTLGPMRGSYTGPYPDLAAAFAAMRTAPTFSLAQLPTDRIVVDGTTITLPPGLGNHLLNSFHEGPATDPGNPDLIRDFGDARATLVGGQCVILTIPGALPGTTTGDHRALLLLDARTGKMFAHYKETWEVRFHPLVGWR